MRAASHRTAGPQSGLAALRAWLDSSSLAWAGETRDDEQAPGIHQLLLGSDKGLRQRLFGPQSFAHPAKLHLGLLSVLLSRHTRPGETVADPMAGSGSVLLAALWGRHVIARELEEHWVAALERSAARIRWQGGLFAAELGRIDVGQADARVPWGYQADCVLFSPPYGNSASTTPTARRSLPYRLPRLAVPLDERWYKLAERPPAGAMGALAFHYGRHPQQVGHLRGARYWAAMREVYTQARAALNPGGRLIVVVKDHIYQGSRVPTVAGTIALCAELGFVLAAHYRRPLVQLSLWQRRRREQGRPVVEEEDALVFRLASESGQARATTLSMEGQDAADLPSSQHERGDGR